MSQQEFEPRQQRSDEELYQLQYPYTWSEQAQQEGMPRDEPYSAQAGSYNTSNATQVPWWARAQPQQRNHLPLAMLLIAILAIALITGGLGILGAIVGAILHIIGALLGALLAVIIVIVLVVCLILALIGHALRRAFGVTPRFQRRIWRDNRRMARRARRAWRDW